MDLRAFGRDVVERLRCGTGYVAPVSHAPTSFAGAPAIAARAIGSEPIDMTAWWRSFHDPLLASYVDRALEQNLDLEQARARVLQARAALKNANAALLPSAQVSGQAGENHQSLQTPIGRVANTFPQFQRSSELYELDLNASWELVESGLRALAQGKASVIASTLNNVVAFSNRFTSRAMQRKSMRKVMAPSA